ncbi:uncharacterized protein [Clytia hemisphaerica]|uniref:EF-hand domain-containing protein n=1 Tax=Clytia hemisphaerica TaxID=252671 RepID=A0A7M5U3K3_9CNID
MGGGYKFSDEEKRQLQKIFNDADDDSSGSIDKKEFKKLSKKLNIFPGEKEFESMFREVDADGSGEIDFEEFMTLLKKILAPPSDEELLMKFKKLDQGNKGYLTFKDLKAGFQAMNYQISDSAIKDMIAVASDDGDDQVSIEEFSAVAKRPRKL